MTQKFTHLHVHTHYSLLDGLSKIGTLLDYTKELGMDGVAITDHGNMYGAIEFYQEAKKRNIKPIMGMEGYITSGDMKSHEGGQDNAYWHITLLAKNNQGYKNLIQLASASHLEGFYYKPRFDKKLLRQHASGLIALSGCLGAEIPSLIMANKMEEARRAIKEYANIFGKNNFYLEVQHHANIEDQIKVNDALYELSATTGVGLVATQDSHYLKSEDAEAHDILLAIQTGNTIDDEKRLTLKDDDFSLRSPQEMAGFFKDHPEAIENTQKIADSCDVEIVLGKQQLPLFEVPEGYDDVSYLSKLSHDGLKHRYGEKIGKEIMERLDYELSVISKTGFSSYMLIVADFVRWAKEQGITVGPGRGSAAGSIVSYLLGITNVDPIKFKLIFERFLNPERISMPDIDLDFADTRRDEVLRYVSEKYGANKVAQIITFGTMAARVSVRDVGRALGYQYGFCDQIAKLIPPMHYTLKKSLKEIGELKALYNSDPQAKRLLDIAQKLEGVVRHASTHACGVVITKEPLQNMVPLQHSSSDEKSIVTQFEMHAIEDLGLLKMDFLGLRNLTIIEKTLNEIENLHGKRIDIDNIPLDDPATYKLLQKANTTGVFQLESSGMKRYLKELKPTNVEDIIAMVALYRPGPMEFIPDFIARKHGKKEITYLLPELEPILKNTYGIAVYQEQVLQMAREIAGFTYSEADILRKAIGKKIKKLLDEQKEKFIEGAVKNGVDKKIAEELFHFIEPFARYGFNRAHATCYALIANQTAYLKAHYPVEFMASLLNAEQKNIDRIALLLDEAQEMKIKILPPSINESGHNFTVINADATHGVIRFGLAAIKNVGSNVVQQIIEERNTNVKYSSLENLLERIASRDFNKKSIESLIKTGAFDEFDERSLLLGNMDKLLQYGREQHAIAASGQFSLFGTSDDQAPIKLKLAHVDEATQRQKLTWEKELLGLYITGHPLSEHKDRLAAFTKIQSITRATRGNLRIAAIINNVKKIITKNGKAMMFVGLEDLTGKIEVIIFPTLFKQKQNLLEENKIIVVEGKVGDRDGELKILANNIREL